METPALFAAAISLIIAAVGTHMLWGYMVSGRYLKMRQRLRDLILQTLSETGQAETFLFVVSRDARQVIVQIPLSTSALQRFENVLSARVLAEIPETRVLVAPLEQSLEHLQGAVAVWGPQYGDVHVARGGVENAA